MAYTITLTTSLSLNGAPLDAANVATVSADTQIGISESVAGSTTNANYPIVAASAKQQFVYLKSDAALTVKVNSTSAPTATVTLVAGVPVFWTVAQPTSQCPIGTTDVTNLYVTNAGSSAANLVVLIGLSLP
jgi:hypothetical protein